MARPQTRKARNRKQRKKKQGWRNAANSDRYELYELSVQDPETECDLIEQVWSEQRSRKCSRIREDFCGTAIVCVEWVRRKRTNTAVGVDIDNAVLDWAGRKIGERLSDAEAGRIELLQHDVRTVKVKPVDSVLAMNFSYYLIKERDALRKYFKSVRAGLVDDGLFLLDAYGGSDSFLEVEEDRDVDGFTYVWDQHLYNPITGDAINYIHFRFPDGSKIKKAFAYDWRLWTLPEIREILLEAGFKDVAVYWEGTDEESGEGDGTWSISTRGEACPGWIAYVVAKK